MRAEKIFMGGRFIGFDEDGGLPANIAASGSEPFDAERSARRNQIGSRAAVVRRSEGTCFSSPSDDEEGGLQARSAWSERGERSNQIRAASR